MINCSSGSALCNSLAWITTWTPAPHLVILLLIRAPTRRPGAPPPSLSLRRCPRRRPPRHAPPRGAGGGGHAEPRRSLQRLRPPGLSAAPLPRSRGGSLRCRGSGSNGPPGAAVVVGGGEAAEWAAACAGTGVAVNRGSGPLARLAAAGGGCLGPRHPAPRRRQRCGPAGSALGRRLAEAPRGRRGCRGPAAGPGAGSGGLRGGALCPVAARGIAAVRRGSRVEMVFGGGEVEAPCGVLWCEESWKQCGSCCLDCDLTGGLRAFCHTVDFGLIYPKLCCCVSQNRQDMGTTAKPQMKYKE